MQPSSPRPVDLHAGEEWQQRMGAHGDDRLMVQRQQCHALRVGQCETPGIGGTVGEKGRALAGIMRDAVQRVDEAYQLRLDRRR